MYPVYKCHKLYSDLISLQQEHDGHGLIPTKLCFTQESNSTS